MDGVAAEVSPDDSALVGSVLPTDPDAAPTRTFSGTPVPAGYPAMIDELRDLLDRVAAAAPDAEAIAAVTAAARSAAAALDGAAADEPDRFSGRLLTVPGRAALTSPVLSVDSVDDERVLGRVRFGQHFLGSNGVVHGGAVPLLFDDLLGRFAIAGGRPRARTAYLHVDYRSVAPIDTELRVEAWFEREEGRKRYLRGTLSDGDRVCSEASALFVALRPDAR